MTTRLKILVGLLLMAVVLCGIELYMLSHRERNDYQRGRLVEHPRPGPMDANQIWSSALSGPGHTHRAIGFAEPFGTYIYWETGDNPRYADLLHTSRGNYSEGKTEFILDRTFGGEFPLRMMDIQGASCLIPKGMSLSEALSQDWLLVQRTGISDASPFAIAERTPLDDGQFRSGFKAVETKKDHQDAPGDGDKPPN